MVKEGWDIVVTYYQDEAGVNHDWVPYSVMKGKALIDSSSSFSYAKAEGVIGRKDFSVRLMRKNGSTLSPWHDIPLQPALAAKTSFAAETSSFYNMVVEIPASTTAKIELSKGESGNPFKQDVSSSGAMRYFTYGAPFFNYGLFPQTWEDSEEMNESGFKGDNDPLDVVEIGGDFGENSLAVGQVIPVKVLGAFELIDEGEVDFKIIVIRSNHADATQINSMDDLERAQPGVTARLVHWFKFYKTAEGKGVNQMTSEIPSSPSDALKIIRKTHEAYLNLFKNKERMKTLNLQ